jgi:hypothetical protein
VLRNYLVFWAALICWGSTNPTCVGCITPCFLMKLSLHGESTRLWWCRHHRVDYRLSHRHHSLPPQCTTGFHQSSGARPSSASGEGVHVFGGMHSSSTVHPRAGNHHHLEGYAVDQRGGDSDHVHNVVTLRVYCHCHLNRDAAYICGGARVEPPVSTSTALDDGGLTVAVDASLPWLHGYGTQPLVLQHWSHCHPSTSAACHRCFDTPKRHLLLDTSHSLWLPSRR